MDAIVRLDRSARSRACAQVEGVSPLTKPPGSSQSFSSSRPPVMILAQGGIPNLWLCALDPLTKAL
jgi:hypothetical protein